MSARRIPRVAALFLLGFALMASSIAVIAQQRDTRATTPVPAGPSGTAVLSGVVTSEDGSRPVRFAYLVLLGTGTGTVKVSSSDADGKFTFVNLPADRYTLGASKPPYLGTVAGARRPGRSGTPIAVADGQKITNVAIRMPMGASISGVITDEKGQTASGVSVSVQQVRMQNGERTLVPPAFLTPPQVDESGHYRIYGLLPGQYVVVGTRASAGLVVRPLSVNEVDSALRNGSAPPSPPAMPSNVRYAPVYYPGTTRVTDAVPIDLVSGEERINVDFKLELMQMAKVEGSVVLSDGQMLPSGTLIISSSGASPLRTSLAVRIGSDGRFSVPNLMPGMYTLLSQGSGQAANQYASTTIEVSGADVLGVQLTMRPTMTLQGRMQFSGPGMTPSLAGRRMAWRSLSQTASGAAVTPTTDAGTFTITNISPGAYVIGAPLSFGPTTDSMTWALESVMADGRDITDLPFDITPESLPKEVVVTYSDRFQELSGKLSRADGAPVPEYTIVVFPQDKAYWMTGSRRIVVTRPGTDGRFTLSGAGPTTLPAGMYYLAAVTDIDRNEQFDPAFLASIVPAAAQITLQPGEKKVQDLVVK